MQLATSLLDNNEDSVVLHLSFRGAPGSQRRYSVSTREAFPQSLNLGAAGGVWLGPHADIWDELATNCRWFEHRH
jgi:hypothetical protein